MEFVINILIGVALMWLFAIDFIGRAPWNPDLTIIIVSVILVVLLMVLCFIVIGCVGRNKTKYELNDHSYKRYDPLTTENDYVTMPLSYVKNFENLNRDRKSQSTCTLDTVEEFNLYDKIPEVTPAKEDGQKRRFYGQRRTP